MDPFAPAGDAPATRDLVPLLGAIPKARGPVAGGPFTLQSWHRGLDMIFARNAAAAAPAKFKTLRVVFVTDASAALALFENGSVDVLGPYAAPDWQRRVRAAGADVTSDTGASWFGLRFSTTHEPAKSARFSFARRLDAARLIGGLVQGEGTALRSPDPEGAPALDAWAAAAAPKPVRGRPSLTIAYATEDDLPGVIARAIQFQVRAVYDVQPIALEAGALWRDWIPGARMQAAIELFRDPPGGAAQARFGARGAQLLQQMPVLPLYRTAVSLGARASKFCGARPAAKASAAGPFWNAGEWKPCA